MGLVARTFRSTWVSVDDPPAVAKYRMASLAVTVLPAPDSPDITIDWCWFSLMFNSIIYFINKIIFIAFIECNLVIESMNKSNQ